MFNTSNYGLDRSLPKGENEKVIGLFKDKLGGKTMTKLVELRIKTFNYLINGDGEDRNLNLKLIKAI